MLASPIRHLAVIDFETTSLLPEEGRIIEGAVALVEVHSDGSIGNTVETYWSFNDPGFPIPEHIIKLTSITDEQVRGQVLDWNRFNGLLQKAELLVSHNALFDRVWLEKWGNYKTSRWGCSLQMINWNQHGMPCRTLKHLAWEHRHFPNAHRAIDDVETLLFLLRSPCLDAPKQTYGQELLAVAAMNRHLVFAQQAPFETKDLLKGKGFRWSAEKRVWWKLVTETELEPLLEFMKEQIYSGPPRYVVTEPIDSLDPQLKSQYGLN
jgi:DNA polymerase-3 subunit epsilon